MVLDIADAAASPLPKGAGNPEPILRIMAKCWISSEINSLCLPIVAMHRRFERGISETDKSWRLQKLATEKKGG